jgi:hypothetical protein
MHQTCPRCSAANPPDAVYCFHDGNPLSRAVAAALPRQPGVLPFLTPFVFPAGQVCQDFDQFALACQQRWAESVKLLQDGHFARFFGTLGRLDLVMAATAAAAYPDGDRGLDQFLSRLPTQRLAAPRLHIATTDLNLGTVAVGADRQFDLRLTNQGMRLLYGTVSSDCDWLGFADGAGVKQKLFCGGGETVIRVHVHGKQLHAGAKGLLGRLAVESNGGTATVTVHATVPVRPFPAGALAGATSPRQIAEKAKRDPSGAAALFESGAVARWYADNGWSYPVKGASANGLAAVQQFFEALGLTRPPKVKLSEPAVRLQVDAGSVVRHVLYVRTDEKRHVFAEARSDQPWLKVQPPQSQGAAAAIPLEIRAPSAEGTALEARVAVRANGDQRFVVPVTVTVRPNSAGRSRHPAGRPRRKSFLVHSFPLFLLLLCLLGLGARDYLVTPRGPDVVVENEPEPAPLPPEPLRVQIDDEPLIWTREVVAKVTHKIEDEPEERKTGTRPPPPVKVSIRDEKEEGPAARRNLPVDPDPRIAYRYHNQIVIVNETRKFIPRYDRFGITARKERNGQPLLNRAGLPVQKPLTYSNEGSTNNTRLKIDGKDMDLGKGAGKWLVQGEDIPDDPERKTKKGTRSVLRAGDIEITQILEIVPSKLPVEVGPEDTKELKYVLDTLLVRYILVNKGKVQHTAGLRVQVDTLIGYKEDGSPNDGVPFTIPGRPGLCDTRADLRGKDVPAFIQALEVPDLQKPGLVAHLTLKPGGKLDPPDRVCLAHWEGGDSPWETRLEPIDNGQFKDSAVFLYWNEKPLKPGQKRQFGFAYGMGGVDADQGTGKLGITLGGSFEPGQYFTVTAYVNNPVPKQTLTLELPEGLKAEGATKVLVPRPAGKPPTSVVTWRAKVLRTGEFRIRVRSSTGLAQSKTILIARGEEPDPGKLALKLTGPFEPGKSFAVEAEVIGPAPEQKLRLELPGGLERVAGEAEQAVGRAGDGESKWVRWDVKVHEAGSYRVGVRSSTGVGRAKTLTIVKANLGEKVQIALKGDIEPGKSFAVLARVVDPAPDQKLTLILPDELERVGGEETQPVPPGKGETKPVTWEVKVLRTGKYTLRVRSSTGVTYPKTITLQEAEQNVGRFDLNFVGAVAPGKEFQVVALVQTPVPRQELKLTLPPGLQLVEGAIAQLVPAPQEGGARVNWTVRVVERGRLPVRVDSSTGIARTRTMTISGGDAGPGQIFGK